MTILDGPKTLISNALFPAGYVLLSYTESLKNLGNFCAQQITGLPLNTNITAWAESGKNVSYALWQGCTLENAITFGNYTLVYPISSTCQTLYHRSPVGAIADASTILTNHHWTIATAAAMGVSFTLINAVLKRSPLIKHHPYFRALTSLGLAGIATHFGADALGRSVTFDTITSIAVKVIAVGALIKTASLTAKIVRGGCNAFIYVTDSLNWGGLPEGPKVVVKKNTGDRFAEIVGDDLAQRVRGSQAVRTVTPASTKKGAVTTSEGGDVRQRTPAKKAVEEEEVDGNKQPLLTPQRDSAKKAAAKITQIAQDEQRVDDDGAVVENDGEVVEHSGEE